MTIPQPCAFSALVFGGLGLVGIFSEAYLFAVIMFAFSLWEAVHSHQ